MRVTSLRLGARVGNSDVASLERELDSLRSYRDVLHETMRGLVTKSQGKLAPGDGPELASGLIKVAELLAAFNDAMQQAASSSDTESHALVEEAQRTACAAEAELAARSADFEREARVSAEQIAAVEEQRDSVSRQLAQQRRAGREWDAAAGCLEEEAAALDAALSRLAASEECKRRDEAAARAHVDAEAAAIAAAHAAHAGDEAARISAAALAEAREAEARAAEARAASEAAHAATRSALEHAQRDAQLAGADRDRWRAEAHESAAEVGK